MLSAETESRLAKMLLILADGEAAVEVSRQLLGNQLGFDPYNLFRLLDTESKGWVDSVNLIDFLRRHSVYAGTTEAQLVVFQYDSDLSGTLSYSEFLNMILSERHSYLRNSSQLNSYPVPYDVEFSFLRLLEKELDYVKCLNGAIKELSLRYDFNGLDAFKSIDVYNLDNINSDSISKFLVRNYISPSESDCNNIVKRLDLDRNLRVSYSEFRSLLNAYSTGIPTTVTHVHYSPVRRTFYSPLRTTRLYCSPLRCYSPLRSYYSPPKRILPYSTLKNDYLGTSTVNISTYKVNDYDRKSSPLRSTGLTSSPKRVTSPLRSKTNFNESTQNNSFIRSESRVERVSSNYLSYEEEVFLNYVRELLSAENSLEVQKCEVALKSDFNMEDVFSVFEKYNKGYVTEFDFKDGLNAYFGLFPLLEEISTLYKRYDTEKLGSLNYGDFFNMLSPVSLEYRKLVENRVYPNSTLVGDPLSLSTKFAVKSLLNSLVSSEQSLESHRIKMKNMLSFNPKKVFELIGGYASNYFSERDFMLYLDRNGVSYSPRDIELLFIRFSRNKKGLISFSNFLDEISPKY